MGYTNDPIDPQCVAVGAYMAPPIEPDPNHANWPSLVWGYEENPSPEDMKRIAMSAIRPCPKGECIAIDDLLGQLGLKEDSPKDRPVTYSRRIGRLEFVLFKGGPDPNWVFHVKSMAEEDVYSYKSGIVYSFEGTLGECISHYVNRVSDTITAMGDALKRASTMKDGRRGL